LPLTIIDNASPDLGQLLTEAGEDETPPPEPAGGIPAQRLSGWVRWPLRLLLLPFVLIDLQAQRVARLLIRPPYKQAGACKQRGNCCRYIMIQHSTGLLGKLYLFWNKEINGFYPRFNEPQEYEGKSVIVMGCRYLKADGRCGHYHLRPAVCRKWPMIEYFGYPRILKGCGFKALPRK
jgi:hypothetical protein